MSIRSANPALNEKVFETDRSYAGEPMTLSGTVSKTGIMLFLLVAAAVFVWRKFFVAFEAKEAFNIMAYVYGGLIAGLVLALVTIFKKEWAAVTAPLYAIAQGVAIGGLSALFESMYPGIVIQAVALTFGTLFCMLMAYSSGLIKATENFKLGVVAATGAILLIYIVSIVLRLFGINMPFIHDSGPIGIIFSLVVVTIAALNLVLDFDFIEKGVEKGAPKHLEWYGAFGLMVTLIWLYIEILHLLAKLQSRR